MRTFFWCVVIRLQLILRRAARFLGRQLRHWGARLLDAGEVPECRWGPVLFSGLFRAELEVIGRYPKRCRGPIIAARFVIPPPGKKMLVALSLNWVADAETTFGILPPAAWRFSGPCSIIIDPSVSPLHKLPDGTLWFMMPGGYGIIRFSAQEHLPFAGSPEVGRVYTYF